MNPASRLRLKSLQDCKSQTDTECPLLEPGTAATPPRSQSGWKHEKRTWMGNLLPCFPSASQTATARWQIHTAAAFIRISRAYLATLLWQPWTPTSCMVGAKDGVNPASLRVGHAPKVEGKASKESKALTDRFHQIALFEGYDMCIYICACAYIYKQKSKPWFPSQHHALRFHKG